MNKTNIPISTMYELLNPPSGFVIRLNGDYITLPDSPIWEKLIQTAWNYAQGDYPDFGVSWHYHLLYSAEALLWIPEEWRKQLRFLLDTETKCDYLHCLAVSFDDGNGFVILEVPLVVDFDTFLNGRWRSAYATYRGFATNKETIAQFLLIADRLIEQMEEINNKTRIVNLQW